MVSYSGDDLGDNYVPEDIEYESNDELADQEIPSTSLPESTTPAGLGKKRKREKEKEKRKTKKRKVEEDPQTTESGAHATVMTPELMAELVESYDAKVFKSASALELEDKRFSEHHFVDTSSYTSDRSLENLPQFIATVAPTLKIRLAQKPANKGAPTLLFVAPAALRAADIARILRGMKGNKGGEVAKLFARHFKLEEHANYLRRTSIGVGVGTPGRLGQLLNETDSLSLKALTHIIIDFTFRDMKNRTIFHIPETRDQLLRDILRHEQVFKAVTSGKVKLILY